ncbi:MAG: GNAT family N-acetyltransferase [Alteromonadaceae bacterium]|nr:GNAT family N-acetyltransferase [Alteromonadaceae bacterium]
MQTNIETVDYNNQAQAKDLVFLLNSYAEDPMGGNEGLSDFTKQNLALTLAKVPYAFSLILYADGQPAGLANCILGFSTFACKPLINIHDLAVHADFRGKGFGKMLLEAVKQEAIKRDCCKVTLEVLSGNEVAYNAYLSFGFKAYQLDDTTGNAHFLELKL